MVEAERTRSGILVPVGARIVEHRETSGTPLAPVGQRAVVPAEPDMLRATKRTRKKKTPAVIEQPPAPKPVHTCYAMGCGATDEEDANALRHIAANEMRNDKPTGRVLREWWACPIHESRWRPGYLGQGTVQDWRTVGFEQWYRPAAPSMSKAGTRRGYQGDDRAGVFPAPASHGRISGRRKKKARR